MSVLEQAFVSGRIVDLILMLVMAEAIGLVVLWTFARRGVPPRALLANLVSGAALMLAVRSALLDAPWTQVAAFLSLSFLAHLADLAGRWRS
jgi:hypothetical protein